MATFHFSLSKRNEDVLSAIISAINDRVDVSDIPHWKKFLMLYWNWWVSPFKSSTSNSWTLKWSRHRPRRPLHIKPWLRRLPWEWSLRLLKEWLAALVRTHPSIFSFYLVTPLPYTQAAIREASHALTHLNAIGTGLLSNHEGYYLGNPAFTPFFSFLNSRSSQKDEIVFIHPSYPVLHLNIGSLIPADPTSTLPVWLSFTSRPRARSWISLSRLRCRISRGYGICSRMKGALSRALRIGCWGRYRRLWGRPCRYLTRGT